MNIFKIVHPNGRPAQVRATCEQLAVEMLIEQFHDRDWEFGQTTILHKESGPAQILRVGKPLIPAA